MRKPFWLWLAATLVALGGAAAAALYLYNRPTVLRVRFRNWRRHRPDGFGEHVFNHQHEQIRLHIVPVEEFRRRRRRRSTRATPTSPSCARTSAG